MPRGGKRPGAGRKPGQKSKSPKEIIKAALRSGSADRSAAPTALTDKQLRFVEEYLVDLNATQAAIRAGYSAKTAGSVGQENLTKPEIAEAISAAQLRRSQRTAITADTVLARWWEIANADPNELIQYRRTNCRHCWGKEHQYQFTAVEFEEAEKVLNKEHKDEDQRLDPKGGLGFDGRRPPHPDCPECHGEGVGRIHALDTRNLSPAARRLYAGAKHGKDGLQILMQDQGKALENVARHLGMFTEKHEHRGEIKIVISGVDADL